ncbi:hypothetical protein AB0J86_15745 [Micromonospora sp. NPDC049559]|uniref:hypothetical protein n=1 Tax=Micromonospora sp. NPDC049559 TaxID=3155923 RepID=UPI00342F518B
MPGGTDEPVDSAALLADAGRVVNDHQDGGRCPDCTRVGCRRLNAARFTVADHHERRKSTVGSSSEFQDRYVPGGREIPAKQATAAYREWQAKQ